MSDVKIHIGAESEAKDAIDQTIAGLEKLRNAIDKTSDSTEKNNQKTVSWKDDLGLLKGGFEAFMASEAVRKFAEFVNSSLEAYGKQEQAIIGLTAILQTNSNVTNDSINSIMRYATQMQELTGVGDELIESQMQLLAASGLNEKQMETTTTAALALSKAGLVTLDIAMRSLNQSTIDGSLGFLTRYVPALRQFSTEQLKAGAAIDYVNEHFGKLLDVSKDSVETIRARMNSLWGDQMEKFGQVFAQVYANADRMTAVITWIGDAGQWVLDKIVKLSLALIDQLVAGWQTVVGVMKLIADLVAAYAKSLWAPVYVAFFDTIEAIKLFFINMINFMLDKVEGFLRGIGQKVSDLTKGVLGGGLANVELPRLTYVKPERPESVDEMRNQIWATFGKQFNDFVGDLKDNWSTVFNDLTTPLRGLKETIDAVQDTIKRTVPEAVTTATSGYHGLGFSGSQTSDYTGLGTTITDMFATAGPTFQEMLDAGKQFAGQLDSINMILSYQQTIYNAMTAVLKPFVNQLYAPLVGILIELGTFLGNVLMPILRILAPVIELVADIFVVIYNYALVPFGNMIIGIANLLYNLGVVIKNIITLNWGNLTQGTVAFNNGFLQTISLSSLQATGENAVSGNSPSSQTTYVNPPDIKVYITVQGDVIAEDLGKRVVEAIEEYLGTGAHVSFLEGT